MVQEACSSDKPKPPPVPEKEVHSKKEKDKFFSESEAKSKANKEDCIPPSETETRYCMNKKAQKIELPKQKKQKSPKMTPCDIQMGQKPVPKPRCVQQVLKKNWMPVKVESK